MMYSGMITIYKEAGYTSSDVVARLRGILRMRKIGHTGTLDPAAEGVLPVCLGSATRLCDLIADRDKEYEAVMRLGTVTDTEDMTGQILRTMPDEEVRQRVTEEALREAAAGFTGPYDQIPPMYAAIKVNGRRLYQLAREGKVVERKPRRIVIHDLEITGVDLPLVRMRVRCSKGTYIRSLCRDLGEALGTGGCMEYLLRTRVGIFTLDRAIRLDEAERLAHEEPDRLRSLIMPVDSFFEEAPALTVRPAAMRYLLNGNALQLEQTEPREGARMTGVPGERVRLYDEAGTFYALYRLAEGDRLLAEQMFLPRD